jgi:plasmid stabilization system protein ParE
MLLVPVQETRWTEALYRVSPSGARPERLGTLPLMTASYRFSADGTRGIIRALEQHTDVHVVRGFAQMVNARP